MFKHYLHNIKLVNRIDYLREFCSGKRVLHLGATAAPTTKEAISSGRFIHTQLDDVARYLVGIDIDKEMIQWLFDNHGINNIKYGNIEILESYPKEDFDIIVVGEILEHLSNPGEALDALRFIAKPFSKLIITVPNAYSFKGFCRALIKHELIHPDHVLHHSPHTLKSLLKRSGFLIDEYFSYVNGGQGNFASAANLFLRLNPQLAEGIGVICSSRKPDSTT